MRRLSNTFKHRRSRNSLSNRLGLERLEQRAMMALVSHWTGDNTLVDAVGPNHATLANGAGFAAGQVNEGFNFDGIDDILQAPTAGLPTGSADRTIELWARIDQQVAEEAFFAGYGASGSFNAAYLLGTSNGRLFVSNWGTAVVGPTLQNGHWYHVAATNVGQSFNLYLNGIQVGLGSMEVNTPEGSTFFMGRNTTTTIGDSRRLDGMVDEVKVYDHALTAAEVLANFNAAKGSLQPGLLIADAAVNEGAEHVKFLDDFAYTSSPVGLTYGPGGFASGYVFATNRDDSSVSRFDASTGAPAPMAGKPGATFVSPGDGGLVNPRSLAFGPDGNLYVQTDGANEILRFDGSTGEFIDVFVPAGSGGLNRPVGVFFHTDGYLYVTSVEGEAATPGKDSVLRYDAYSGAPAGISGLPGDAVFVASGLGGLRDPAQIEWHDGYLYVSSQATGSVLRYHADGTFKDTFVGGPISPWDLAFDGGFLYVTSWGGNVFRYDASTGAFVSKSDGDGLSTPCDLLVEPGGAILVAGYYNGSIRRYVATTDAVFTVSLTSAQPTTISVSYATADGLAVSTGANADFGQTSGSLTFAPGETRKHIRVPINNDALAELRESYTVVLSGVVGDATISDGTGTGLIKDNDSTKFYVVNDAPSGDRTYEYADASNGIENYALATGNTAPRGAASNAAGTRVWVVDANKKVYVYDHNGAPQGSGSWSAGSLTANSQIEGVATNGTDVWIVENISTGNKADKVYRYTGAASRISGSQNAASNFNLNSGNTSPKDIVTDGTYLYVVNDSTTDKVFKYTLAGALVSSWTLGSGGRSPTGITLDPSNPAHLWIVDSATDRVYEYANAINQANGSTATAVASFALAAGNTNPQGIADPPPSRSDALAAALAEALPIRTPSARTAGHDDDLVRLLAWDQYAREMQEGVSEPIGAGKPVAGRKSRR